MAYEGISDRRRYLPGIPAVGCCGNRSQPGAMGLTQTAQGGAGAGISPKWFGISLVAIILFVFFARRD